MQASERVNTFIIPFEENFDKPPISPEEMAEASEFFTVLCESMMLQHSNHVEGAILKVTEDQVLQLTLQVKSEDGSYLYIAIFGCGPNEENIPLTVVVTEHDNESTFIRGNMYGHLNDGTLIRTHLEESERNDDDDPIFHFSAFEYFQEMALVHFPYEGQTLEEVEEAEQIKELLEEDFENLLTEQQLGYNRQPVGLEEIRQLSLLLLDAEPFDQ